MALLTIAKDTMFFILKVIEDHDNEIAENHAFIKFLCSFNDDRYQEILLYNDSIDILRKITMTLMYGDLIASQHMKVHYSNTITSTNDPVIM